MCTRRRCSYALLVLLAALATAWADPKPADGDKPQPPQPKPAAPDKPVDPVKPGDPAQSGGPTTIVTPPLAPLPVAPVTPPVAPAVKRLGEVNVAGLKLEGLTLAEAKDKLLNLADKLDTTVQVTDGIKSFGRTRRDLGASLDVATMLAAAERGDKFVPLKLKIKAEDLHDCLLNLAPEFKHKGSDAKLVDDNGKVKIVGGEPTHALNLEASVAKLAKDLEANAAQLKLKVELVETQPDVPASTFAGITGRLMRYATPYNAAEKDRSENMRVAIKAIDGLLIPAGAVFSLNETVGERTPARGFRKAHIFEEGKITEGYGGGVSQVTGTLFNAALFADLHIVTYRTHSRPVRYLPVGRDATVAWGQFDMKFKNDTDAPVFVRYTLERKQVVCILYGKPVPGRKVTLSVKSTRLADNLIEAALTRIVTIDGKQVKKEVVGKSHYEWVPEG